LSFNIDWEGIAWETRGFLGLDDTEPIPRDELVEQAKTNGWTEREIRASLRETDALEPVDGDVDRLSVCDDRQNTRTESGSSDGKGGGNADENAKTALENGDIAESAVREAFVDALEWFHEQLDRDLPEDVEHDTARDYYREGRGWHAETIDEKLLGYAPANYKDELIAHLFDRGHGREAILATGLFGERDDGGLYTTWSGRYVLPYFDVNGRPAFAISRATDPVHPADWKGNKYDKLQVTREDVAIEEPIYGLDTVRDGEPVLITEGIADAITAHQAGYACISPVTVQFKQSDREDLLDTLEERDVSRAYLIQDAERPTSDVDDRDRLTLQQFGDGVKGAVRTAAYLSDHGVDARVADLPRPGLEKVDLDDYIQGWNDDLTPLLASAKPVDHHPAFGTTEQQAPADENEADHGGAGRESSGSHSALFDLDITDVTGESEGFRGKNPLGHHGESEDYFYIYDDGGDLKAVDHKYGVTYTPLTYLLADAKHSESSRSPGRPGGSLDDSEIFVAWKHAKERGDISADDPIPLRALEHVAREATDWDGQLVERETHDGDTFDALPAHIYNAALDAVREEYDIDPGRDPIRTGEETNTESELAEALLDQDVVVEPVNALRAAEAVEPEHLDEPLPELERADVDDVAIAVAIAEGVIDSPDGFPENGRYTDCYYRARDHYGAPLPKYLDSSTLEERADLVFAALSRITPRHILDNIKSEVTVEDPAGQAIAKINPVWEDSESGERILAGYGDGFLCLEHGPGEPDGQQTFSPLQFVAVENDLIGFEYDYPRGENFKQAYRLLREEYGAPLPKWRATVLEHFAVLPPAVDLVDGASARRSLSDVHADVEELIRDALTVRDRAQLVTVFPGGGKTYSAAKAAADTPLLYVAGRNELKEQIEDYAREVSADVDGEVTVVHLPILAENQIQDAALREAVGVVRERGGLILKQREELLDAVDEPLDAEDSEDSQDVDIERATCPTAEGEHGPAWRLVVQTARELGLDPSVIHQYDPALFGEELPCQHAGDCEYALGWESVRDPDNQADILVGSPGHAYVDSATTYFDRDENGDRITRPRAVVIDEFPEDEYFAQFGDTYMDHATWLSEALVGIDTREGVIQAGLDADTWVDLWLDGDGNEYVPAASVVDRLQAGQAIAEARSLAEDLRDDGLPREARLDTDSLTEALDTLASGDGTTDLPNLDGVQKRLSAAVSRLETDAANAYARGEDHAGALYALADDLGEITESLAEAGRLGGDLGTLAEDLEDSLDELPIGGDLRALCQDAVAVIRGEDDRDDLLRAAVESLTGGREGCQELAIYADDGYAHPQAWKLLAGAVATPESSGVSEVSTGQFSFDDTEGGTFKRLKRNRAVVAACQNHKGALVSDTPEFTDIGGAKCPVVGLDATGRTRLWRLAIGRDTEHRDIHDSPAERRGFLRDVMNLRVVQTSETANPYFSDPHGKNFGEDLELVDTVTDEFTGYGPDVIDTKAPAVITSKKVMNHLRQSLADALGVPADATYAEDSPLVNFGNMKGSDALGERQVGVILGSPHYGDQEPEKWALLAGEDAAREDGYGMNLDYGSETANAYLKNMREDHVMQAILRAGRNDDATVVFAHTAALREDLPVDYQAVTLTAHSKGTLAVAEAAKALRGSPFTVQDVVDEIRDDQDAIDERQVRNILGELAGEGYLRRVREGGPGVAHEFELEEDPGTADIDLPEPELPETPDSETSEKSRTGVLHTWNFRSLRNDRDERALPTATRPTIPARETLAGDNPPPLRSG
jgi:hypothetical protein